MKRLASLLLITILALPAAAQAVKGGRYDQQIQNQVTAELAKRDKFKAVTTSVDDGIVTLNGEVELYIDKVNAEKRVRKVSQVDGVRNHIRVASNVHDEVLREKLANKLRYDRVGYGITFNNLSLAVQDGIVTIGGKVRDYPDRDSALAILETTPGVKDVIDEIDVAPTSPNDDALRIALARAIYGNASLRKYAQDPQAPIRILVENGHVELHGVVTNKLDKQIAYTQASAVPGVFSVKDHIVIASDRAQ